MAKRNSKSARPGGQADTLAPDTTAASDASSDSMEQRVLAFARQVGYVAGTIQMKAEGWMDRAALTKQLAGVRDGAAHLLEQLGSVAGKARKKPLSRAARKTTRARSGGVVDAPGKTHRKRAPSDPDAALARSQARKIRAARPMEKTAKHRNRG
jgi:hypothetical protein